MLQKEIPLESLNENVESELLSTMRGWYLDELKYIGIDPVGYDSQPFFWAQDRPITIYILFVSMDSYGLTRLLCFAKRNNEEKSVLNVLNMIDKTSVFAFTHQTTDEQKVHYLLDNHLLDLTDPNEIITNSVLGVLNFDPTVLSLDSLKILINKWVDDEYSNSKIKLNKQTTQSYTFSEQTFYIDKYNFPTIMNSINSDEFNTELSECLKAYENEWWFICATGLGTCLETLMALTIEKHGVEKPKYWPNDPTAHDYLAILKKAPTNMTDRDKTRYSAAFMLRNSVDHHNTGRTAKQTCDMLMTSITSFYNEYYLLENSR